MHAEEEAEGHDDDDETQNHVHTRFGLEEAAELSAGEAWPTEARDNVAEAPESAQRTSRRGGDSAASTREARRKCET